ncbi:hypothetical protein D3C78_1626660 [compost metagenome]
MHVDVFTAFVNEAHLECIYEAFQQTADLTYVLIRSDIDSRFPTLGDQLIFEHWRVTTDCRHNQAGVLHTCYRDSNLVGSPGFLISQFQISTKWLYLTKTFDVLHAVTK